MKKKLNKKGNGNYEFLLIALVCLILTGFILFIAVRNSGDEKFQVFRYNAKVVALNAVIIENETNKETVYMEEMLDQGLISPIKNPFGGDKLCNAKESKVQMINGERRVTLQCGNYLIYQQSLTDKMYTVYQVTNWYYDKQESFNEERMVYNLKYEGKNIFDDFYEDILFLNYVNHYLSTDYKSVDQIDKKYEISSMKQYRKRSKVKEVKS